MGVLRGHRKDCFLVTSPTVFTRAMKAIQSPASYLSFHLNHGVPVGRESNLSFINLLNLSPVSLALKVSSSQALNRSEDTNWQCPSSSGMFPLTTSSTQTTTRLNKASVSLPPQTLVTNRSVNASAVHKTQTYIFRSWLYMFKVKDIEKNVHNEAPKL